MPFSDRFIRGFEAGHRIKMDKRRLDDEAEERDIRRQRHKLEIDRMKIQDKESARKASFDEAQALSDMFEPPDQTGMSASPFAGGQPVTVPGKHPEVQIPEGGYGQPATSVQPTGMRSRLTEIARINRESERQKRTRTVTPEQAASIGPGVTPGEMDEDILSQIGMTGRERETRKSVESEGAASRRTQERVAGIYANARGTTGVGATGEEDEASYENWAKMLNSGDATLSQVPAGTKGRFRTGVVNKMMGLNLAVMTPKLQAKLEQFIPAQASLDKIEQTLASVQSEKGAKKLAAALQFDAEVKGLSRMVGRALGEKGVFTDQDKKDFAQLMAVGSSLPGGAAVGSMIAGGWDQSRIDNLRAFLDGVKQREFSGITERTGGRTVPGMGADEPTWIVDAQGNPVRNPKKKK